MTDYSTLQSLLTDYDVLENVERGYNAAKVEAAFQRVSTECARLGVSITEGRKLCAPSCLKIEVTGPAFILHDGNEVHRFDTAAEAIAANKYLAVMDFVEAGSTRSFSVAA